MSEEKKYLDEEGLKHFLEKFKQLMAGEIPDKDKEKPLN